MDKDIIISLWMFFILVFGFDILCYSFRHIYCYLKRKMKDCYSCFYWNCPKYQTCYYNEKCLNETRSRWRRIDFIEVLCCILEIYISIVFILLVHFFLYNVL